MEQNWVKCGAGATIKLGSDHDFCVDPWLDLTIKVEKKTAAVCLLSPLSAVQLYKRRAKQLSEMHSQGDMFLLFVFFLSESVITLKSISSFLVE